MFAISYDDANGFVTRLQHKGVDVRWDGWTMVFFQPHKAARRSVNGHYRNGDWGFETRVSANTAGKWLVDYRLARTLANRK